MSEMVITESGKFMTNYLRSLVNRFFKILPIREENQDGLCPYMESLFVELSGCASLLEGLDGDASFVSLLSTLQYLISHPAAPVHVFKREVFKSISIVNYLSAKYGGGV